MGGSGWVGVGGWDWSSVDWGPSFSPSTRGAPAPPVRWSRGKEGAAWGGGERDDGRCPCTPPIARRRQSPPALPLPSPLSLSLSLHFLLPRTPAGTLCRPACTSPPASAWGTPRRPTLGRVAVRSVCASGCGRLSLCVCAPRGGRSGRRGEERERRVGGWAEFFSFSAHPASPRFIKNMKRRAPLQDQRKNVYRRTTRNKEKKERMEDKATGGGRLFCCFFALSPLLSASCPPPPASSTARSPRTAPGPPPCPCPWIHRRGFSARDAG